MRELTCVAVFCGSNVGDDEVYVRAAAELGRALARRGVGVVYGGTHMGLMGALADAVIEQGGRIHGVITQRLQDKGHLHPRLTVQETVATIAARKSRMLSVADACIALPGGVGTLEELLEAWTLNQLENIDKPLGLLNVAGYYDPLLAFIDSMVARRFLPAAHRDGLCVAEDPDALVDLLERAPPMTASKWL